VGGILVRKGNSLTSQQLPTRLSLGALVKELAIEGERLSYQKITGTGPLHGWVSLRLNQKDLLVKPEGPALPGPAPEEVGAEPRAPERAPAPALQAMLRAAASGEKLPLRLLQIPGEDDTEGWCILNLLLGRYGTALQLASGIPKLEGFVLDAAALVDSQEAAFLPVRSSPSPEDCDPQGHVVAYDGTYPAPGGARIGYSARICRSSDPADTPLVIHFHGTEECAQYYCSMPSSRGRVPDQDEKMWRSRARAASRFLQVPASVVFADFRGFGWSSEGWPRLSSLCEDAEALIHSLPCIAERCGLPWPYPGPIVAMGYSAGTVVATHLATVFPPGDPIDALVLDAAVGCQWPYSDALYGPALVEIAKAADAFSAWLPEVVETARFHCPCCAGSRGNGKMRSKLVLDTVDKLAMYQGPVLMLHSPQDATCLWVQAMQLKGAALGRVELVRLDDSDHETYMHRNYWPSVTQFLRAVVAAQVPFGG